MNSIDKEQFIDILNIFHINERVQLMVNGVPYPSRVEDIGSDHLIVAAPIHKGNVMSLGRNKKLVVGTVYQEAFHEFDCYVSREVSGRVPSLVLSDLQHRGPSERRHYPRINDILPVYFRMSRAAVPWEDSITDDIGGGGMRVAMQSNTRIAVGDLVDVKIAIPDQSWVEAMCRVLRVNNTSGFGGPYGYWAAEFVKITPKDRNKIASYVEERRSKLSPDF